ncbi:hypothetical protein [Ruegeria sp. HKCCSP351]|uniref:hypothetical protein n=1 Tax=Ruegeria sp. HKCCSP351 TaxID=2794832 RepID=UPI001AE731D9|nr:hypothetical protein [Ruegeria sp. HKCCSP351]
MNNVLFATALTLIAGSAQAQAISGDKVCSKANADSRLNGMSVEQCLCLAGIAQKNMSPELYELWAQAMYYGESREKEMVALKQSQNKTVNQMKKTKRQSQKKCGIK